MPASHPTRSRPGAHWYLIGIVLVVTGPIALAWALWAGSDAIGVVNHRFRAPGDATVQIATPGSYSIWRGVTDERSLVIPEDIRITIIEPMLGAEHDLEPVLGPTERIGSRQRFEIARTTLGRPGPYAIVIGGGFPEGEFEFGPSIGPGIAGGGLVTPRLATGVGSGALTLGTLLFGSLSLIGFVAGAAIIVLVWIARDRSRPDAQGHD